MVSLVYVQASVLYGAELWWDDRKGSGVKNRSDELQKLENQLGRAIMGNFRTANLEVVMAVGIREERRSSGAVSPAEFGR